MKRTLLFVLLAVLVSFNAFSQGLLITEVVDGTASGGYPKFVEISNSSDAAIDLNGYKVNRYSNGGTSAAQAYLFASSYSLPAKASIILTNIDNTTSGRKWTDFSLSEPTNVIYGISGISANGDDVYELVNPSDVAIDIYGVIGVDGTGEDWDFLDSYANRNVNILNGRTTFDASEWSIAGPNTLDGQSADLSSFLTPGSHFSTPTSVYGFAIGKIKVSPNPFTNELRFDSNEVKTVAIYNASGQLVKNVPVNAQVVSTADLAKGMYILHIKFEDGSVSTQKVLKQ